MTINSQVVWQILEILKVVSSDFFCIDFYNSPIKDYCRKDFFELFTLLTGLRICWMYPLQRVKTPTHKKGVSWLWYKTASKDSESIENYFITITPRSSLVIDVRVQSMGQIDLIKNYLYSNGLRVEKNS